MNGDNAVQSKKTREPIAIVGLGCRFPGAPNPRAFWKLLREGREAVREIPPDRWDAGALHDPDPNKPGRMISRRGGFIDNVDQFDWRAFRIPPREAKYMDPQHRLLLEVAWEAIEDAGLPAESLAGSRTGVFVGIMWNDYLRLQSRDQLQFNGYGATGNAFAFAPNRISYFFDLRGPSIAIDGACAASLASVHAACQSLWMGETTLALAGGVNLILSPEVNIMLSKAGILSPEGRCKTLDARADGFVRGEGAGIVVLKPLSRVTPSDRVYAFIRGTAINHNGHNEWIMAANPAAEEAVIRDALQVAGVDPAEIDYVELHGTALPKGDPIEAKALGAAIGTRPGRKNPCIVGSVKTNIGHLDSAAGIASLIKVALSLYYQEIPQTLHIQHLNPEIPMESLGLVAQMKLGPWPSKKGPSLAGVTAVSMAGSNAHAVLESPFQKPGGQSSQVKNAEPGTKRSEIGQMQILTLSARSSNALRDLARAFKDFITDEDFGARHSFQNLCYTASVRRSHHEHRLALVDRSLDGIAASLTKFLQGQLLPGVFVSKRETDDQRAFPDAPSSSALAEAISLFLRQRDEAGTVLPSAMKENGDRRIMLEALGTIYVQGHKVDWKALFTDANRCVELPTYPWQRERLWLEELGNPGAHVTSPTVQVVRNPVSTPEPPNKAVHEMPPSAEPAKKEPDFLRSLKGVPIGRRHDILRAHVRDQVVNVLGLDSSYPIKPQQGLFDVGLNSLAVVELINRLQASLGQPLPSTLVFEYPTVEALSEYLAKTILPLAAAGDSQTELQKDGRFEPLMDLPELEQLSEDEAEALLIKKLAMIEKKLS